MNLPSDLHKSLGKRGCTTLELDQKTMKKLLLLIAFGVALLWGLQNYTILFSFLKMLLGLVTPFLLGLAMAFILNVLVKLLEQKVFGRLAASKRPRKWIRPVSILLSLLFVIGLLLAVFFLVIPELGRTLTVLQKGIPDFLVRIQTWGKDIAAALPQVGEQIASLEINWGNIGQSVLGFLQNGATNVLNSTVSIATSVFNGMLNFVLAFVFCLYALFHKETLARQAKRVLYACVRADHADRVLSICTLANRTFSNFITGQCTEAVILGLLCFIGMSIFRFPYALMISVLVGFTALIPIFGAFIGVVVGAFMILVTNPIQAVWFVLFFVVLQQLEGNLIYPRVVGTSVGLPAMWVMVAVTLGGSMFGILGMLTFVPLCSVLYALMREVVTNRLRKRQVPKYKIQ